MVIKKSYNDYVLESVIRLEGWLSLIFLNLFLSCLRVEVGLGRFLFVRFIKFFKLFFFLFVIVYEGFFVYYMLS